MHFWSFPVSNGELISATLQSDSEWPIWDNISTIHSRCPELVDMFSVGWMLKVIHRRYWKGQWLKCCLGIEWQSLSNMASIHGTDSFREDTAHLWFNTDPAGCDSKHTHIHRYERTIFNWEPHTSIHHFVGYQKYIDDWYLSINHQPLNALTC